MGSYEFDWRPEEHAEVTAFLVREQVRSGMWRVLRWAIVLFLALATVVVLASAMAGDFISALRLGLLVVLVGGILAGFPTITGRLQAWRVQRTDPNVGDPIHHTFDDTGLHIGMRTLNAELKWEGMHSVRETPTMFLFHYSKRRAYYLPKRVAGSSADWTQLSDWIQTHLPDETPFVRMDPGS